MNMECKANESICSNTEVQQEIHKSEQTLTHQYPDKSVTDEVSQILTSLPESAANFNASSDQWTEVSTELPNNSCHDNSSPLASSSSDDDEDESEVESSELDEEASTNRRCQCIDEMTTIERQFTDIRDQLYRERHTQITKRLDEVGSETAPEYLQQLQALQQNKQVRMQVAEMLRNLRNDSLRLLVEAEKQSNNQHLNNEKLMLIGRIQSELDEKIRRLEEDRDNVDTEMWTDTLGGATYNSSTLNDLPSVKGKRMRRKDENVALFSFGNIKRKRKPVTVSGPYIVYMLRDKDIMDDWATIKRAINVSQRRSTIKSFKKRQVCKFEDGRFSYCGKYFTKGQSVTIKQGESRTFGTIVALSSTEIRIRQNNGVKSKLYIHQLQRGRYTLQHR